MKFRVYELKKKKWIDISDKCFINKNGKMVIIDMYEYEQCNNMFSSLDMMQIQNGVLYKIQYIEQDDR